MAVRLQEDVSDLKKRVKRTEDVLQSLHSSLESAKFDNINEHHESQGLTLDDLSPLVHSTPSPDVLLARGTVSQAQMCCSINRDQSVNSNLSASKLSTGLIDDASFREWKPLHPRAATPVSNIHGGFSKLKGDRQQTESQLHVERKQTLQAEDKMQSHILRLEAERDGALRNLSDVETALLDYRKHLAQTLQQKEQREEELVMQVQMLKGENQALRDKCWRIEGSKGELDHEKEKLDRLRGILSEAQRMLERDRREVDCVRQTLEHEKDKCQQDGLTLQRNKEHLNVDKQRLNEMIQKLESEQQNLDCTRIAVETRQSEVNEERKLLDAETTSLHKERMALDALREDLNQKMAKLEMEKKYAEEERASLHKMRLQVDHQKEEQNEESSRCAEECAELEIGWKDLEKERKALESEIERHRECWGLGRELATFAERNLSGIETFLAHFVHNMSLTGPQSTKLMSWLKEARREQTANVAELEERLSEVVSQLQFKEMEIGKLEKELHEKTEAYVASASLAARYAPSARRDKEALRSAEQVVTNLRSENDCQTQELHELKGRMEVLRERTEAAETNAQCHKEELSHLREELQIIQRLHAEVLDEYQKELEEVKHMNSELKKTVSSCREKLKACTTSMERGRQDMDEERKRQHAETSRLRGELSDALSQQQETHASAQALQEMLDAVSAHGSLLEETQAKLRAQVSDLEKDVEHHRRLRVDEKSHTQAELAELQMQLKFRSQHLEQITATNGKLQADITAAQDEGERQHEAAEQSRKREEAAKNHAQQLQTEMEQLQERADKMELLDVEAKALRVDLVICAEETRIAEEEAVKARKEAQEALSTRDEAEEAVARAREALSGVEEKFTALNNQLRVSRDCANQRGKELDHLSAILHERQLELQQRSAQVLELEGRVSTRQVEMEVTVTNLQNVLEKTQKQVSVLKERQYKTERNLHDKCSELEKANNRNEKLTHNLEILEQDMLRERNHAEQLHQMSTDVRNRLEFLQLECSRLQTELEEMTRVCQEKELRQRHLAEELGAKQARICLLESRLQAEGSVLST